MAFQNEEEGRSFMFGTVAAFLGAEERLALLLTIMTVNNKKRSASLAKTLEDVILLLVAAGVVFSGRKVLCGCGASTSTSLQTDGCQLSNKL